MIPDDELAKIDALIAGKPEAPPERIYGWLDTQLSVARYYGGINYQGHRYVIAYGEDRVPLVRADVLEREAKARRDQERAARDAFKAQQGGLF